MGRAPCCSKVGLHKGPWTPKEDALLTKYIQAHGEGQWKSLPKKAGLLRCGKSCRLRWMNYLRPDIKRGNITQEEDDLIIRMHSLLGNRWSLIAGRLPGRTDNEIKNYWNTHLGKKLRNNQGDGTYDSTTHNKLAADPDQQEQQPTGTGAKKKNNNSNKKKKNNKQKNGKSKGGNNGTAEEEKTQVYLPKPIRIKALTLPRTESGSFTFDSNNSACDASIGISQEKESPGSTTKLVNNNNVLREVGDKGENDGFGFFGDDHHDLVNDRLEMECDSYFATDDHGTLEKLYEEYLQLLNMDRSHHAHYDLDSFTESLLE